LEAELEELEKEGEIEEQRKIDEEFLDVGPSAALPDVPVAETPKPAPAKKKPEMTDEEKELAELAAFAS